MIEVTEVRIKLMENPADRLQAFCSITFNDAFVIRDLKIIEGTTGPFVAMPSRKLTNHCAKCGCKNHLRASYCTHCGNRQKESNSPSHSNGRAKLYADIAHPINSMCRELIQQHVITAFEEERRLASQPGYVPRYEDITDYSDAPAPFTSEHAPIDSKRTDLKPGESASRATTESSDRTKRIHADHSSDKSTHHPNKERPLDANR